MQNKTKEQHNTARDCFLTPEEVATTLQVTTEQVRRLIRQGRLHAINIGTGKKRPLYRISTQALAAFLAGAAGSSQPLRQNGLRQRGHVPDFFPGLR